MSEPARDPGGDARVVVIVGAGSGIGRVLALRCARQGDALVLAARRSDLLRELDGEIAQAHFGRLGVVVCAAGWNMPRRSIYEAAQESWRSVVETSLSGAFSVTSAAVPAMRARDGGLLVYLSSSGARRPDQSGAAYQASKAGLAALAHATTEECRAGNIRTTVIYPGVTDTPFLGHRPAPPDEEARRPALQPDDVAAACAFVMGPARPRSRAGTADLPVPDLTSARTAAARGPPGKHPRPRRSPTEQGAACHERRRYRRPMAAPR